MSRARGALRRLGRDCRGSQAVEFVLAAPLLIWATFAFHVFTDTFRVRAVADEATAVLADVLSRQTVPIDLPALEGLRSVAAQLTGFGDEVGVRVTQLRCVTGCEDLQGRNLGVVFSQGVGLPAMVDDDLADASLQARIPLMSPGDRVVLVQTSFSHAPLFRVGLAAQTVESAQTTRMRFAPRLCWETCNP